MDAEVGSERTTGQERKTGVIGEVVSTVQLKREVFK